MKNRIAITAALMLAVALPPVALGADLTDIGYLDQARIGTLPQFVAANRQLGQAKAQLDKQFATAMRGAHSQEDQQRVVSDFQQRFLQKQRALLAPLLERARAAVASVTSSKNLSVVVDKRIVIYGGQDITQEVIDLLQSPAPIVPPVNTPAPSEIGFVDQNQLNQIPKLKSANDDFDKWQAQLQQSTQAQMAKAKNDDERRQILKTYQQTVSDREKSELQPLVDQTKSVIGDVARKHNLILVVDSGDLVYGGSDITQDVQNALK
ncbi:MAG: OmpH family outer membrane protein [Candidatus Eremiobacteraeota bacterium]|nr:OmpH family outer membrane protein [Candidatus Eremiobacteraeota bacterium]